MKQYRVFIILFFIIYLSACASSLEKDDPHKIMSSNIEGEWSGIILMKVDIKRNSIACRGLSLKERNMSDSKVKLRIKDGYVVGVLNFMGKASTFSGQINKKDTVDIQLYRSSSGGLRISLVNTLSPTKHANYGSIRVYSDSLRESCSGEWWLYPEPKRRNSDPDRCIEKNTGREYISSIIGCANGDTKIKYR